MSKHYRKEKNCLNCGNFVSDKFCGKCGQENIVIKESIWAFIVHGIAHYFHYDSKFRNTVRPLVTRPGQLTADYLEGRRARHIPPMSLYLFITIVYFLISPLLTGNISERTTQEKQDVKSSVALTAVNYDSVADRKTAKRLVKEFRDLSAADQLAVIRKLGNSSEESDLLKKSLKDKLRNDFRRINMQRQDSTVSAYMTRQAKLDPSKRDKPVDRFWKSKKIAYREKHGREFETKELDRYLSKLLFILMPLFALFMKINFRKNKKYYIEYLIYTVHLFSFAFLSFIVRDILIYMLPESVDGFVTLIFLGLLVWYTYRSIRVVYQRSRGVTIRKLFSLLFLFSLALSITYGLGMVAMLLVV